MKPSHLSHLQKAIFNAANLNGAAAIALSWDLGTRMGSVLFAIAMIWGIANKYRSLSTKSDTEFSGLKKYLTDPSITAQILMLAAGYNCIEICIHLVTGAPTAQNIWLAFAWFTGFLGDNALRKLDNVNFSHLVNVENLRSRLKAVFKIVIANPAIFYNMTGICFTGAMAQQNHTIFSKAAAFVIIAIFIAGILYTIAKAYHVAHSNKNPETINDGFINYSSAAAYLGQSILAVATGNYYAAFAQSVFTLSSIRALYETRSAVHKKYNTQFIETYHHAQT